MLTHRRMVRAVLRLKAPERLAAARAPLKTTGVNMTGLLKLHGFVMGRLPLVPLVLLRLRLIGTGSPTDSLVTPDKASRRALSHLRSREGYGQLDLRSRPGIH
jgi:hypothetical protein